MSPVPRLALALSLGLAAAAAAHAQPGVATYPKSRAMADVAAWVTAETPLQLSQVVDVGPSAVTAVTSATPTGDPRGFLANIASEAVDPAIGRQEDILSWRIPVEIDCDRHAVRLGDMTGFQGRDLKSAPRVVRAADNQWVTPTASAPLGAVVRALCDRDFKRPFAAATRLASGKTKPPPPPGPPPEVVAARPPTKPQPLTTAAAGKPPTAEKAPAADKSASAKAPPRPAETAVAEAPAPAEKTAAAEKPARAARPIAHGTSPYAVQIGATPSEADAKTLVAQAQKRFAGDLAGLKIDVASATVDGKTVYRALISGFAGPGDANALCARLKAAGQACFVRR